MAEDFLETTLQQIASGAAGLGETIDAVAKLSSANRGPDAVAAYEAWIARVGPAGLPKDICARLQQALVKALAAPKARELFAAQGFVVKNGNGEETARLIRDELGRSQALIKSASIVAE